MRRPNFRVGDKVKLTEEAWEVLPAMPMAQTRVGLGALTIAEIAPALPVTDAPGGIVYPLDFVEDFPWAGIDDTNVVAAS